MYSPYIEATKNAMGAKNGKELPLKIMPYIRANVPSINVPKSSTETLENLISEPPKRTVGFAEAPKLKKNISMENKEDDDEFFGMVRGKSKSIIEKKSSLNELCDLHDSKTRSKRLTVAGQDIREDYQ